MATYIGKVNVDGTDLLVGSTLYGVCSTAAATTAKTVTVSYFDTLFTGVTVHVKFSNANTASSPTLNVNSTGAKAISGGSWNAGEIKSFTYDGSSWVMNDYNVGGSTVEPATATPAMDGTAAVGTSAKYAREDHVHPSDTSKLNTSGGTMTGNLDMASGATVDGVDVSEIPNEYVKKAGDTMTGALEVDGADIIINGSNIPASTPSSDSYGKAFLAQDAADVNVGYMRGFYQSNGYRGIQVNASRDNVANGLFLSIDDSNNRHVSVTSPAAWRSALEIQYTSISSIQYHPATSYTSIGTITISTPGLYYLDAPWANAAPLGIGLSTTSQTSMTTIITESTTAGSQNAVKYFSASSWKVYIKCSSASSSAYNRFTLYLICPLP